MRFFLFQCHPGCVLEKKGTGGCLGACKAGTGLPLDTACMVGSSAANHIHPGAACARRDKVLHSSAPPALCSAPSFNSLMPIMVPLTLVTQRSPDIPRPLSPSHTLSPHTPALNTSGPIPPLTRFTSAVAPLTPRIQASTATQKSTASRPASRWLGGKGTWGGGMWGRPRVRVRGDMLVWGTASLQAACAGGVQ